MKSRHFSSWPTPAAVSAPGPTRCQHRPGDEDENVLPDRCRETVAEGGQPSGEYRRHQGRTGGGGAMCRHRIRRIESRRDRKSPLIRRRHHMPPPRSAPPVARVRREAHDAAWRPIPSSPVPPPPSDKLRKVELRNRHEGPLRPKSRPNGLCTRGQNLAKIVCNSRRFSKLAGTPLFASGAVMRPLLQNALVPIEFAT